MSEILQEVFFVSSVSGLIYKDYNAAGDISCIIVEGKRFYPATITKLTSQCSGQETPVVVNHPPACAKCIKCHWPNVSCR